MKLTIAACALIYPLATQSNAIRRHNNACQPRTSPCDSPAHTVAMCAHKAISCVRVSSRFAAASSMLLMCLLSVIITCVAVAMRRPRSVDLRTNLNSKRIGLCAASNAGARSQSRRRRRIDVNAPSCSLAYLRNIHICAVMFIRATVTLRFCDCVCAEWRMAG